MTHASGMPAACAALAFALAAPVAPAQAQTQTDGPVPQLSARRIVIDAITGRPRLADHEEVAAAAAAPRTAARTAPKTTSLRAHPMLQELNGQTTAAHFGAAGKRVTANKLAFSVVRRGADGRLVAQCVTGEDAATHARHAHAEEADHAQ